MREEIVGYAGGLLTRGSKEETMEVGGKVKRAGAGMGKVLHVPGRRCAQRGTKIVIQRGGEPKKAGSP